MRLIAPPAQAFMQKSPAEIPAEIPAPAIADTTIN